MGHTRLGTLPQSRKWREVVELIAVGANVQQVASSTVNAADSAFSFVKDDRGYHEAVWILTQLGLASSHADPLAYLRSVGIDIPANTSLPGIAVAISAALSNQPDTRHPQSDLAELAHRALVDAVVQRLEPKLQQQSLFNLDSEHARQALLQFGSQKEFAKLSREFFSRLTQECMNYFLSKTLATQLGEGQRFVTTNQMAHFEEAMEKHCRESSKIVEQFSEEWFSKHRFTENKDISRESVEGFASYALKKIRDELKMRAKRDEQ
jgi:hypothetical protein